MAFIDENALRQFFDNLKGIFYRKPANGIPATDMAQAVQTSLGKADNSVSNPISSVPSNYVPTSNGNGGYSWQAQSGGLELGETSDTAYRGDRGKTAYDHSQATGNPHGTTASQVGAYTKAEMDAVIAQAGANIGIADGKATDALHTSATKWASSTAYSVGDFVVAKNMNEPQHWHIYRCLISHTSSDFMTDLAAQKWEEVIATDLIKGKADKVQNSTNGHFAGLDANGNITDSGKAAADFIAAPFVVTITYDFTNQTMHSMWKDGVHPTLNKTFSEIQTAVEAGQNVVFYAVLIYEGAEARKEQVYITSAIHNSAIYLSAVSYGYALEVKIFADSSRNRVLFGSIAVGEDAESDAYPISGDTLHTHTSDTENPHSVTKAQVGLGNVDNTSDANKPVSTAQQTAINAKYSLPANGIPKTDLASGVQSSLDLADTALQSVPNTYRTAAAQDVIDSSKLTEPSTGLAVGKYFRIASIDNNGHAVLEAVDAPSGGVSGALLGKENGYTQATIDENGNIIIPSAKGYGYDGPEYGVVSTTNWETREGILIRKGIIGLSTSNNYNIISNATWRSVGGYVLQLKNLDLWIKAAMTDGIGAAWTDEQMLGALLRMGCTVDENGFVKWTAQS